MKACLCLSLLLACGCVATASKVTPVEKVIELLKSLQAQTEGEAKKEAAAYDKYSCFCKEQADEKQYMIEKSTKKIEKLDAQIEQLEADISELNSEISDLADKIDKLATEIEEAQSKRSKQHAEYKVIDADTVGAINAMEGAIKALKDSKADMDEGAKLDLAQVKSLAGKVLSAAKVSSHVDAEVSKKLQKVAAFVKAAGSQPAYEYRSNDIIKTLEDLKDTFLENKKEDDEEEFKTNSAWEKKDLNLKNVKKFSEEEKHQKEQFVEAKTEEKETAEADRTAETKDMNADKDFMGVLTEECQGKAEQFDQRSTTRSGELVAIAKALEELQASVAGSYGANKKLAQLQVKGDKKDVQAHGHWAWVEDKAASKAMSFLQLRGSKSVAQSQGDLTRQVTKLLQDKAASLKSTVLLAAAVRAQASEDHFVKVRSIIKDLVSKLEADAAAEADHKSFCDKAIGEEVAARDEANAEIESLTAEKSKLEAEMAKLEKEIAQLAADIASLKKALKEATELRQSEQEENEATIATAEEGKAGVEFAIKTLEDFYNSAFVQYTPPNSGRDGKTVGDMAPDTFEGDYHGNQEKSKGIIGLLEIILSDFERTIQTVSDEEKAAQEEFESFKKSTEEDIDDKDSSKTKKEDRVVEIKDELVQNADSLKEQKGLLATAKEALEELESQCIRGEETYEERVAKRQKEIEALKEAHTILENWKGF